MNWADVLNLALALAEGVVGNLKGSGMALEQIQDAEAALVTLRQFQGSPVTKAQLESLRG